MQKLLIPQDKANHAIYGALIFLVASVAAQLLGQRDAARWWGAGAAVAAGALKELYDHVRNRQALKAGLAKPHGVEGSDLAWTAGGALLVWLGAVVTDGAPR